MEEMIAQRLLDNARLVDQLLLSRPPDRPHAFRHSSGVQVLRLSGGNLRAVQEHLRHADIQTTTVYTKLTQSDLQEVISKFDTNRGNENRDSRPAPHGT